MRVELLRADLFQSASLLVFLASRRLRVKFLRYSQRIGKFLIHTAKSSNWTEQDTKLAFLLVTNVHWQQLLNKNDSNLRQKMHDHKGMGERPCWIFLFSQGDSIWMIGQNSWKE